MSIAEQALSKSSCRGLFGNGADPLQVLRDGVAGTGTALTSVLFADLGISGPVAKTVYAPWTWDSTTGSWIILSANIVINFSGPWNTGWGADRQVFGNCSDDQFRAETLIHELVHVFAEVFLLGGSLLPNHDPTNSVDFDREVFQACFGSPQN